MASAFFSFEPFDYGTVDDIHIPLEGFEKNGVVNKGHRPSISFGSDDWGDFDLTCRQASDQDGVPHKGVFLSEDMQPGFGMLMDDFQFTIDSPPFQAPQESATLDAVLSELSEFIQPAKNEKPPYPTTTLASLELLNGYKSGTGYNRMSGENLNEAREVLNYQRLSTEEVMRVAGAQYIQFSVPKDDNLSMLSHPFGCAFSGLINEETKDVELAHLLLASAEKIGNQQYGRGSKLLDQCACLSASTGNPVQRIAYYFAQALTEKVYRETGRMGIKAGGWRWPVEQEVSLDDMQDAMMNPNAALLECHQLLPFSQVLQFPSVQAIVESVAMAKRVHLIDLGIKSGITWTPLMQALAERQECPIEMLKITAVGTKNQQRDIQETGNRLASFAESMGLPFSFNLIVVSNMEDLKEDLFELQDDEAVAIYSAFVLRTMLGRSNRLDSLMRVLRNLNPCIIVVIEVEGNHNSPAFFNRFIESLFFFSAFFDCVETCMDRSNRNRMVLEELYLGQAIQNIVATEGEERTFRHVGIDVWRPFFARFGMVEAEFSRSSMYQANLVGKQFPCWTSCTLDLNGKSLIIGWKGTPLHSLSAWKFRRL